MVLESRGHAGVRISVKACLKLGQRSRGMLVNNNLKERFYEMYILMHSKKVSLSNHSLKFISKKDSMRCTF